MFSYQVFYVRELSPAPALTAECAVPETMRYLACTQVLASEDDIGHGA